MIEYAEARTRARIAEIEDGEYTATDWLEAIDGDLELRLTATVDGEDIRFDFTGSSAEDTGNLNCPISVTASACYFAVRVLTDPDIPASAGAYRPVEVIVPEGTLLNASSPAAVVAGNVETSSRVADLCLAAFGQGTRPGHDEQLHARQRGLHLLRDARRRPGRLGDADGPSAVHVAMSNTLNTPIEALEIEFPIRATEYSIRRGTGGAGAHRGGDGLVRDVEALEPMDFAVLSERRRHHPPGADGGGAGALGRNQRIPAGGEPEELEPKATGRLEPGDRLRIETPGGGGFGDA